MWLTMAELTFPQRTPEIGEKACTNLDFSGDNKPFALSALKRLHSEHEFMHLLYLQRYIPKLQKRVDIQDHMIAPPNSKNKKYDSRKRFFFFPFLFLRSEFFA